MESTAHETSSGDEHAHGNRHHNVPSSRGGSDETDNLSGVEIPRHALFHRFASNYIPTELGHVLPLHSIGLPPDRRLSIEQIDALFKITTMREWFRLYDLRALRHVTDPCAAVRSLSALEHTRTLLLQEMAWIRETIGALDLPEAHFPVEQHLLITHAAAFFDEQHPADMIRNLFDERHQGELSWVKPVKVDVRDAVLSQVSTKADIPSYDVPALKQVLSVQYRHVSGHEQELRYFLGKLGDELKRSLNGVHAEQTPPRHS